jgi:hypothetical protein
MKLARTDRSLIAWILYFSILFSALACSIGHGQMAGLQLSGIDGVYCSASGGDGPAVDFGGVGTPMPNPASGFGCALASSFVGLALAAFFGLLGLLPHGTRLPPSPPTRLGSAVRHAWPSLNPRAPPVI